MQYIALKQFNGLWTRQDTKGAENKTKEQQTRPESTEMSYWHNNLWTQLDQATENKAVPYTS